MNYRGEAYIEEDHGYLFFGRHKEFACRIATYYIGHTMAQSDFRKLCKCICWALAGSNDLIIQAFDIIQEAIYTNGFGNRNASKNYEHLKKVREKYELQ